ncbi:MAG: response regulator [Desulfobulbaceae bacterium]|nr:response regulator [Desulfobulbaceae bacterium]
MRKLRVTIFDDDNNNLELLQLLLSRRDYEVLTFNGPVVCPVYQGQSNACSNGKTCADIIITDYQMPKMTGIEMLLQQVQNGCKIDRRNKAVMSADPDSIKREMLEETGCTLFSKPFPFDELFAWLDECEKRIDLSKPLGIRRKEERYPANIDVLYTANSAEKIHKGTVVNFGASGLCFKTNGPVIEEQSIVIKNELPNGFKNASVCWVKPLEDGSCLTGLKAQ